VITWQDDRNGGDYEIYAQRYASIAQPIGANFKVNDDSPIPIHRKPSAAMTINGSFVFAWQDFRPDNAKKRIYSQRYDSSGHPLGANYRVDSDTTGTCFDPDIGIDGSGKFIIVWHDQRNANVDVFGQRYDSSGNALGSNFIINDVTTWGQSAASVAVNSTGNFEVCWLDGRSGEREDIYCRRYSSSGIPLGPSFKVNTRNLTYPAEMFQPPDVAIDNAGNFVVVWSVHFAAGESSHVYAQRYNSSGTPVGSNFIVNDHVGGVPPTNQHDCPAVAMNGTGNFVIAWNDLRNGNVDIYGQKYNASGIPIGSNFRVDNDTGTAGQSEVDVSANGTYIYATWRDYRGGSYHIYAKVLQWSP
jgi:hypothetical protein